MTADALRRDALIVACAISAGIHAALAPEHFAEGTGAGLGFVAAALALAGFAAAVTLAPASSSVLAGGALVLVGLLVTYAFATAVGVPLLHPGAEPVDGLALATKAIEAVALVLAAQLLRQPKGT